jgi:hypothetical protein
MSQIWIYDTTSPFGIDKNGGITYFKVTLDKTKHSFVIDAIENREDQESKKKAMEVISSLKELKDGQILLRIRVKVFRGRMNVKMNYAQGGNKEDYLKTLEDIGPLDKLNVRFSLGDSYVFNWEGSSRLGINIYLEEVVIV